jgi:putative acetyltransferase
MLTTITEERPDSPAAVQLILELEGVLEPLYPQQSRHGYSIDKLLREGVAFFVARREGAPAGCGGVQLFGTEYGEVKRMYVRPQFRGLGVAKAMLEHLAGYCRQRRVTVLRLETGIYQLEAIGLYERFGFQRIPPFGPYHADPLSLCYEKRI